MLQQAHFKSIAQGDVGEAIKCFLAAQLTAGDMFLVQMVITKAPPSLRATIKCADASSAHASSVREALQEALASGGWIADAVP